MLQTICYIWVVSLLVAPGVSAQNARQDFARINAAYGNHLTLSQDVRYTLYTDHATQNIQEVKTGHVIRDGDRVYFRLEEVETLNNERYHLMIDHAEKVIILNRAEHMTYRPTPAETTDQLLARCRSVQYLEPNTRQKAYRLHFPAGEYERVEVFFHRQTSFIEQIVFFYRTPLKVDETAATAKPPRLEMIYTNINTAPEITENTFSEQPVVKMGSDGHVLQNKYKNYQFINQAGAVQ